MGLRRGGSVQWPRGPRAVTRSRPNPKSRSYESLFFFSSPAWSPLYSFLFQANAPAVKETCIPLDNLRQAWPGCSFSIKQNFSCLSFPVPGHPNWRCRALLRGGGGQGWLWRGALGQPWLHRDDDVIFHQGAAGSRAAPLLCAARSILFSCWQRDQISFCMQSNSFSLSTKRPFCLFSLHLVPEAREPASLSRSGGRAGAGARGFVSLRRRLISPFPFIYLRQPNELWTEKPRSL